MIDFLKLLFKSASTSVYLTLYIICIHRQDWLMAMLVGVALVVSILDWVRIFVSRKL